MSLTMCGLIGLACLMLAGRYGYNQGLIDGYKQCTEDRTNKTGTIEGEM